MTATQPDSPVLTPANELEVSGFLQEFSEKGLKVNLRGAGTKLDLGRPPTLYDRVISSATLTQLVDYQPEDLTITVQAGLPLAQLQAILAEQGQRLPLDPPNLPGQTVGGVLATNRSGPRRLLYGTARDLLIGCRFVLADGSIGHSGGRVVKNVAGYDLHKLFIGSYGTLGFLTEVTFKVVPQPQFVGVGLARFASVEKACQAARLCVRSNLMPSALEVIAEDLASDAICRLLFAAEGMRVSVEGQLAGLSQICREAGAVSVEVLEDGPAALQAQANLENSFAGPDMLQLKVATTLTGLPQAHGLLAEIGREVGGDGLVCLRAGNGLAYLFSRADRVKLAAALPLIKKARQTFEVNGGSLVIERAPLELRPQLDAWGDTGDAGPAMQAVKDALDPKHLLNPGVFAFLP